MNILAHAPELFIVVGILAAIVAIITEVIKGVSVLSKIPTDLVVFILSIVLTLLSVFAYASYYSYTLTWYIIVGAIIGGFFVAFVAMFGWEKFQALWERFIKK